MKPLIIGQAPGQHASDPDFPLAGRCGAKLADLCGLTLKAYLERFDRVNLVDEFPGKAGKGDAFPLEPARIKCREIMADPANAGRQIVVLGAGAVVLFGLTTPTLTFAPHADAFYAWCPHPSGANRWWNDPANRLRARYFWTGLAQSTSLTKGPSLSSAELGS